MPDSLQRDLDASYDPRVLAETAGAIQPHGCLIVVDQRWRRVTLTSANLDRFLDQTSADALGRPPSAVLGAVPINLLAARFGKGVAGPVTVSCRLETASQPLHVTAHGVSTRIILELEPCGDPTDNLSERVAGWSTRISGADNPSDVLSLLRQAICELTGLETIEVYRIDDDGELQRLTTDEASGGRRLTCCPFPAALSHPTACLFSDTAPLRVIADTNASPVPLAGEGAADLDLSHAVLREVPADERCWLRQMEAHAALVINLHDAQRRWGLIACHGPRPRYLAPTLRHLLQLLAHTAFQRHALLLEREESLRRRQFLAVAARLGTRPHRPSTASLLAAGRSCRDHFQACGVALVYQGKALALGTRPHAKNLQELGALLDRCSPGTLWHSHRLSQTSLGETLLPGGNVTGMLAAPLNSETRPAGWLLLFRQAADSQDRQPRESAPWTSADRQAAADLAGLLSTEITIWRTRGRCRRLHARNARLRRLAHVDPVAQITNRFRIEQILEAELTIANHGGTPCSLLLLDIDHFKRINDTHGHDTGDQILRLVAREIQAQLRGSDHLGRWGGEEFVIIAPDCDLHQATELADRLCQGLLDTSLPPVGQVSISIGVAGWQPGTPLANWLTEPIWQCTGPSTRDAPAYEWPRRNADALRGAAFLQSPHGGRLLNDFLVPSTGSVATDIDIGFSHTPASIDIRLFYRRPEVGLEEIEITAFVRLGDMT
ncbi:sensor domain-containing diguanylate cyclase [Halomonas sp. BC04]|uniref:sensor domain-containing diguanylate cyclase n=1 Tax=Halomonas sp. BC04 TaxID=1403540 RepID=UPI0003ED80AD|nr:sensor domain-containing diguanylate cyclase [Halomonas sp. BC04]EWG98380.1 hypothetical protein Q427_30930 [Halomonas sp. BC04]